MLYNNCHISNKIMYASLTLFLFLCSFVNVLPYLVRSMLQYRTGTFPFILCLHLSPFLSSFLNVLASLAPFSINSLYKVIYQLSVDRKCGIFHYE